MPLQTLVRARAFLKRTPEDHRRAAATAPGGEMPRVLSRSDLTLLSLGSVVGAGVFVLTGVAAADHGGPSVVLAYIKLRKRNLGPILDANGWAVNAKAKINVPFGAALTDIAQLPPGAHRDIVDPYAERTAGRNRAIVALILVALVWSAWRYHWPDKYRTWRSRQESKLKLTSDQVPAAAPTAPAPAAK